MIGNKRSAKDRRKTRKGHAKGQGKKDGPSAGRGQAKDTLRTRKGQGGESVENKKGDVYTRSGRRLVGGGSTSLLNPISIICAETQILDESNSKCFVPEMGVQS